MNTDLQNLRHSTAHLLAAAVLRLWPDTKITIGPSIENGFYYDFDFVNPISEGDLPKIEKKMAETLKDWDLFTHREIPEEKAKEFYANNPYKLELLDEITEKGEKITFYKAGHFEDLCRGGHSEHPKQDIGAFKLLSIAGAYWRGNEKNKMLTRIYGTAFPTQKELDEHLARLEEAKKRDHRKLGKELGLYLFSPLVGPGLPLYTPKGSIVIQEIEQFMRTEQQKLGYSPVYTPNIAKSDLFMTSGHLQWFKDGMYPPMSFGDEGEYYAKPMNCPFHIQIYQNETRSYRDLPLRYAEFGTVYRYEQSGEINGLLRTRGFTQDDAHIFCREDQVVDEFIKVFDLTDTLLHGLGFTDYWHRLSLPGLEKEKYAGNTEQWEQAVKLIKEALSKRKIEYKEAEGEAAFYGPKLDIIFRDSLGREWQISTIQVDFLQPQRFDLTFTNSKGESERVWMIHRAPLGSRERIMALLLEHYGGAYPVWLAPVQVMLLPIADRHAEYAHKAAQQLLEQGIRVEVNDKADTLQAKIREATLQKVPFMGIIGDKEIGENAISVRLRNGEDQGKLELSLFLQKVKENIDQKK